MEPDPLLAALADVVRRRRLELGLTQENVGNLHRNYVGAVERGELNPTITQLERLAKGLDTTAWELLRDASEGRS